jgi:hypothetical protein
MAKKQESEPQPEFTSWPEPGQEAAGDTRDEISRLDGQDPYDLAEARFAAEVERLQQVGELRRASQITDEEELEDHFDDLSRLYRQTCREMGLSWPPPAID